MRGFNWDVGRLWIVVFCLAGLVSCGLFGQETPTKPPAPASEDPAPAKPAEAEPRLTAADFPRIHAEWVALERQLRNLQTNYRDAFTPAKREEILADYRRLSADAQKVLPKLQEAALAALRDASPSHAEAATTVLGFAAQALRRDEVEQAMELATLVEHHAPTTAGLHNLLGMITYHLDRYDECETYLRQAQAEGTLAPEAAAYLEDLPTAKQRWAEERALREKEASDDLPRVRVKTTKGDLVLELFENEAPETVGNFISLVESGFYRGSPFHRVLGNFMAQAGSNTDDGTGDPGYQIYCECTKPNHRNHFRGSLSMAKRAEPNTGSSQFFITFRRTSHLDGKHTVFGRVIEGWDVLPAIQRRDPTRPAQPAPDRIVDIEVIRKRDHAYVPHKVQTPEEENP